VQSYHLMKPNTKTLYLHSESSESCTAAVLAGCISLARLHPGRSLTKVLEYLLLYESTAALLLYESTHRAT